jgi:Transposase DDE domain
VRWRWGAVERPRQRLLAGVPADPWQRVDTTALPVKHPSRVRGPDARHGPGGLRAGFSRDAAHREWFYGFRLSLRTNLGTRLVRARRIVPAAVDERAVADDLLAGPAPAGLLLDRGFLGRAWAAGHRARGTAVVYAPSRAERRRLPAAVRRPVAKFRNRVETTVGELTETLGLARHGARAFWGLLTRCAATILARTLTRRGRA